MFWDHCQISEEEKSQAWSKMKPFKGSKTLLKLSSQLFSKSGSPSVGLTGNNITEHTPPYADLLFQPPPRGLQPPSRPAGGRPASLPPPPSPGNRRLADLESAGQRERGRGGLPPQPGWALSPSLGRGRTLATAGRSRRSCPSLLPGTPGQSGGKGPGGGRVWWRTAALPPSHCTAIRPDPTPHAQDRRACRRENRPTDGTDSPPSRSRPMPFPAPTRRLPPGGGRRRSSRCRRFPLPVPGTAPPSLRRREPHRPRTAGAAAPRPGLPSAGSDRSHEEPGRRLPTLPPPAR
ncbi:basic salivary proline-rich protein 4-like [Melanerpes formicivorus]|uniref:basic salivary proline-rich protein 4-like n=1 Tax=Melanerpes formicivorus TaxID=211600 RepID=UPI00358E5224